MRATRVISTFGMAVVLQASGCSPESTAASSDSSNNGGRAGSGGEGGADSGAPATGGSSGTAIVVVGGTGGTAGSGPGCSTDLHSVVDGDGTVITTCPPDQACFNASCVPACEAFSAAASSVGCDFLAATPSVMSLYRPGCFAVFIANAWNQSTTVSVERGGETHDLSTFARIVGSGSDATTWPVVPSTGIGPDQVAVLFLSHDPEGNSGDGTDTRCPIEAAVTDVGGAAVFDKELDAPKLDPARQTGRGLAFRITTSGPVSAYSMVPYGGARSVDPGASLLYPTPVWGNNYIAVQPPVMYPGEIGTEPWAQIVALDDETRVELVPSTELPAGGGEPGAPAGDITALTLGAGEIVQWQPAGDLSGSPILADGPIAFYGGQSSFLRDSSQPECSNGASDNAHQQVPPVRALGNEYVAAPYRSRISIAESVPYRLVGFVDGTSLRYDPPQPSAPATLDVGVVLDFEATQSFSVQSQDDEHPFYLAQIMPGCGMGDPTADEEFVNVIPAPQYLNKYVFFTDPSYGTTNLVLVRSKVGSSFADVEVDCLGTITGWRDVGSDGRYQAVDVDLVRNGVAERACTNGRHVASSDGPFGLVVWGLDHFASYAYAAGSGARQLNTVVVPPVVR